MTGSAKLYIAQDRKFDFFHTNTKSICTIRFRCHSRPEQGRPRGGGGGRGGGQLGHFSPGPRKYLFRRSIYSNRAVRSKYSNRAVTVFFRGAVYSKLINKEIWLVRGSYCHCYHIMTFFWSSTYSLGEVIQNGNLLAPGAPL